MTRNCFWPAMLAGVLVAWRLGRREGVRGETVVDMAFWCVVGGVLGAKVWFLVEYWNAFEDKWELLRNFRSGLVFYGGIIGGIAGLVGYVLYRRLSLLRMLDLVAPGVILGLAFGRIGCFLNGCCYGRPTESALGVSFPKGSPAFADPGISHTLAGGQSITVPILPTQLFESAAAFVIFGLLLLLRGRRKFYGEQAGLLLVFYPAWRFFNEFLRGDHEPLLAGLTSAQVFSAATFVLAVAGLVILRRLRPRSLEVSGPDRVDRSEGTGDPRG